ncbi:alpha/beta hydrolase [Qipengyuania sp. RANM35]|uniref:alpha/beta hydrolase n=1 Tax=Qipengyuania sp. RANM35 TaxID=3068635 RepID=UPI0034DAC9CA
MLRPAALACSVFGLALAAPASAQSLSIMTVPVVLAAQPLAQLPVDDARRIGVVRDTAGADFTNLRFTIPGRGEFAPVSAIARPAVDRSFRDYRRGIARFGPFLVLDSRRVALVDETGHDTPAVFAAMRRAFPDLVQVDMVECPGTRDDKANMELGRMIRAAHMVTHVPPIGSVRSGAVELFLAGVERDIADGAEFAVHSWMDEYGREAGDFGENAPENLKYIVYYREMGMGERQARAFYAFTNSVPHAEALWLEAQDMRRWAAPAPAQAVVEPPAQQAPKLAYSDMTFS